MKRILIGLLLVILATSYIVQNKNIIESHKFQSIRERMLMIVEGIIVTPKPTSQSPIQDLSERGHEIDLVGYPPPPTDKPYFPPPYPAPGDSPTQTPYPTLTPRPTPTYAPTRNPWDN